MTINLTQLDYFLSIAEHRGFAAAARARYVSQSALTRQMQILEEEFGTKLLERSSRGVMLTNAGQVLKERAGSLFENVAQLKEDVRAEAETPAGGLVLGMTPSMRVLFAASLIEGFYRRYPQVTLDVIEGLSSSIANAVVKGLCDVGVFVQDDAVGKALRTRTLIEEPMVLVAPSRAGLRMDRPVDVEFVARHPLLVSKLNRVNSGIQREAARRGLSLNILMDVQALHLVIDLVCRGMAYTMVPYSAVFRELEAGDVSVAPIKGIQTGWVVAWSSARRVPIATSRMVDAVEAEFKQVQATSSLANLVQFKEALVRRKSKAGADGSHVLARPSGKRSRDPATTR